MKLFGFEISREIDNKRQNKKNEPTDDGSFAQPFSTDGALTIQAPGSAAAGYYAQSFNIDGGSFTNEADAILKYRAAAMQPDCDTAITEIVNAAIVSDSDIRAVNLILDGLSYSDSVKRKINDEFYEVLKLLNFNQNGPDIFRRWYIDGKIYYHIVIDKEKTKAGIKELRLIDPLKIKKIREVTTKINKDTGVKTVDVTNEYFVYSDTGGGPVTGASNETALKIDPNSIVYVPSGLTDESGSVSISHLHKSVKLVNQLNMMENAIVIYRISRAPERRVFYIDTGNLPKGKAEEYVTGIMAKYRNKLTYNPTTGEIFDEPKSMSMVEDFWLPRREGGRGTEITTLPGAGNLSEIDDVVFFQRKLYRSLNVPQNRLEAETAFNVGRASEITRDEVRFQKFINALRKKFATLFLNALKIQLILKGIITEDDWSEVKEKINIDYVEDNFFSELKEFEILRERLAMADTAQAYIGKYYSEAWVRSVILNQSEEEIQIQDENIAKEGSGIDSDESDKPE